MKKPSDPSHHQFDLYGGFCILCGLLLGILGIMLYYFVAIYGWGCSPETLPNETHFILSSYIFTLFTPVWIYDKFCVRNKGKKLYFDMTLKPAWLWGIVFPLMFGMMLISEFFVGLIPTEGPILGDLYQEFSFAIETLSKDPMGLIILTCLLAPVLEEIIFRGIVLKGMVNKGTTPWKAIIGSALFFGFFHLNPWQFLGAFLLGLVLGWVYYKAKSLLFPIILHMFNNGINVFLVLFSKSTRLGDVVNASPDQVLGIGILLVLIFGTLLLFFPWKKNEHYNRGVMKEILVATHNIHKKEEIQQILGSSFRVSSLVDYHLHDEIVEDGHSFHDNALIKAKYGFDQTGKTALGDDSGLVVPALDGRPGIYSARYAGDHDFDKNMSKVLTEMKHVKQREAYFVSVLCLFGAWGVRYFEGRVYGQLQHELRGEKGFGYDPIFVPDGHTLTFAEMPADEKNKISHRKMALDQFLLFLDSESNIFS